VPRLFVYGTLRDPACQERVVGRRFPARPARLRGYVRREAAYPYVIASADASVDGLLLDDVDAEAMARLDAYEDEGRLYRRAAVTVEVGDEVVACDVYVGLGIAEGR
jgi:gamma-glutamylcyclotransferase (GGCT)/AIG2-like uncharacterized protein YtfP